MPRLALIWTAIALLALSACGGSRPTDATPPVPQLDGWRMPDLPGTVPPVPADAAAVLARLALLDAQLPAPARSASVVVQSLPDSNVSVHGVYPTPGYSNFQVSDPFDAQSSSEITITGSLDLHNPLSRLKGRFVEVGLVTNASYNYAMDPDGDPATDDANPAYLFNQNVMLLCAQDQAGHAFAAPCDYNGSAGIGQAQTIPGNFITFRLQLKPTGAGATGGTAAVGFNGGPYGPAQAYGRNNWGWWPPESFAHARLIVQVYSYNADPAPFSVDFYDLQADNPNPPSWHVVTVDTAGHGAMTPALAVVNGKPAIAFAGVFSGGECYVRARDANGTSWCAPIMLSALGGDGSAHALQVIDGNPALVCPSLTPYGLVYLRSMDADGGVWNAPVVLDAETRIGSGWGWLETINGNPACGYAVNQDLKYVRANDAAGTTWGAPVTIQTGIGAESISLAAINGFPALSFGSSSSVKMFYIQALDANGTSWGTAVDIGPGGGFSSLLDVNGLPALTYESETECPVFVRALDPLGANWGSPIALDGSGRGSFAFLSIVNGLPAVSFIAYDQNFFNTKLKYVAATNVVGDNWEAPITIDAPFEANRQTSLAELAGGNPAIAYNESPTWLLKFAVYY